MLPLLIHSPSRVIDISSLDDISELKNIDKKNLILISLLYGSIDKEKLSKVTGIKSDELQIFLDDMVKDNEIKEENGSYSLVKKQMENA